MPKEGFKSIGTTFTEEDYNKFMQYCEDNKLAPGNLLRQLALGAIEGTPTIPELVKRIEKMRKGNIHLAINTKVEDTKTTIAMLRLYEFIAQIALALDETVSRLNPQHKSIKDEILPHKEEMATIGRRFEKSLAHLEMLQTLCRQNKYDLVFEYFKK